jgi:plasmid stabilization system protein ParE
MATMKSTAANGRQRKTLTDQLDRLDAILDGLSNALTEAVAQAVKDGIAAAVEQLTRRPEICRPPEDMVRTGVIRTCLDG